MIYTIGHEGNYLANIEKYGTIHKLGKTDDYSGGYAFKTREDARRRIDEKYPNRGFAVFGLKADWNLDTVPSDDGWWRNLIRDAEIVVMAEETAEA